MLPVLLLVAACSEDNPDSLMDDAIGADVLNEIQCPQNPTDLSQSQVHGWRTEPDASTAGKDSPQSAFRQILSAEYVVSGWRVGDFARVQQDDGTVRFLKPGDDLNVVAAFQAAPVAADNSWMITEAAYCHSESATWERD